ncbi:unnamed protein product [Arabidopsis lyrata]|nr:unnamed protein product [Arabidopsis lyrata]
MRTTSSPMPSATTSKASPSTMANGTLMKPSRFGTTCDGKQEVFKERKEIDDENMVITFRGLEGHVMEQLKVYDIIYQFSQKSPDDIVCKITMIWEKRTDDSPEPSNSMKFLKSVIVDMDDHVVKA